MRRYLSPIILFASLSFAGTAYFYSGDVSAVETSVVEEIKDEQETKEVIFEVETNAWVEEQLSKMTLEEKIGQFFMVASSSNKSEEHFRNVDSLIVRDKVGGVIFFQGDRHNLRAAIERYQSEAEIPLLIAMDAEWGVGMRLFGEERFPYNYTIGAANDIELSEKIGAMIGQECRELGIHINFAPVADVNSNPNNPVIGFRSFGESPKLVGKHVAATVKGMEGQGVMTSIKHFPGHGDTDVDSHYDLPVVNNSYTQINAIDFFPFRSGINAGASTVMIGHLNVPALDDSGTPTSLSKRVIHNYLKGELGFKGIVVSDALRMKAVADRYGATEAVVMAFEAGIDILLIPESVAKAIDAISSKVESGEISSDEIDRRCRKILMAKYKHIIAPKQFKKYTESEREFVCRNLYEKAITVARNDKGLLPIDNFDKKIAVVSIGSHTDEFDDALSLMGDIDFFHAYSGFEAKKKYLSKLADYDVVLTSVHTSTVLTKNNFGIPKSLSEWISAVPDQKKDGLILFGNPLALRKMAGQQSFETVVLAYENNVTVQERVAQLIFGTYPTNGRLPISVNEELSRNSGLELPSTGRLKVSSPEELGIDPLLLSGIDSVAENGIRKKAFPGCQILVAKQGQIIYNKAFGYHTYNKELPVKTSDLYDIASITKIAASTAALMKLQSEAKFDLKSRIENYLATETAGTSYSNIYLKAMLAHQAGLHPWIPFYTNTLEAGQLRKDIYSTTKKDDFVIPVTERLYMRKDYIDSMYAQILRKPIKARKYKYSDVGYYFVKKIVEKQSGKAFDNYLMDEFYKPLGLKRMRYNPTDFYDLSEITPTENDTIFRKQLIHGTVHDQGAAMMGGVGGHAGLFSNAHDLAQLMQLFLRKGEIGGCEYFLPEIVDQYTSYQYYPSNRRGAGFDKPVINGNGGPCSNLASKSSYGHSGFTGTLVWADPEYDLIYVFLSNRVYPDAENWKIIKMNIRTEIQDIIYKAIQKSN